MRQATRAYGAIANKTANPRELEADLLLSAAARLQAIRDGWNDKNPELDGALLFNRKLWSIFVTSATSPENGTAIEEVEVRYQATPLEIGFNSRYLLDITEQIEGEAALFVMSDAASPTIVRDSADASALYVLMPMRV